MSDLHAMLDDCKRMIDELPSKADLNNAHTALRRIREYAAKAIEHTPVGATAEAYLDEIIGAVEGILGLPADDTEG